MTAKLCKYKRDCSWVDSESKFYVMGPDTAKLLRPYVVPLFAATLKSPRAAERRFAQTWCVDTGTHSSVRYTEAVLCLYHKASS